MEGVITDAGDGIRNHKISGEAAAAQECFKLDILDFASEIKSGETAAVPEGKSSDARYAVRNHKRSGEAFAAGKSHIAYDFDSASQFKGREARASAESGIGDISGMTDSKFSFKSVAAKKSFFPDICDRIRNNKVSGESIAETESVFADGSHRFGNNEFARKRRESKSLCPDGGHAFFKNKLFDISSPRCGVVIIIISVIFHFAFAGNGKGSFAVQSPAKVGAITFGAAIAGNRSVRNGIIAVPFSVDDYPGFVADGVIDGIIGIKRIIIIDFGNNSRRISFEIIFVYSAVEENPLSYVCYALRYHNLSGKAGTIIESTHSDVCDAFRQHKVSAESRTSFESIISDAFYTIGYHKISGKTGTFIKSICPD